MQVLLPDAVARRLTAALAKAGRREIGGILMGESLGGEVFCIKDLTVQRGGGTVATFLRGVGGVIGPLRRFFRATGHEYRRFNYLGEWHSHPSFGVRPSVRDDETMRAIVGDRDVGANFAALLIVRLTADRMIESSLTVYLPDGTKFPASLVREEGRHG